MKANVSQKEDSSDSPEYFVFNECLNKVGFLRFRRLFFGFININHEIDLFIIAYLVDCCETFRIRLLVKTLPLSYILNFVNVVSVWWHFVFLARLRGDKS